MTARDTLLAYANDWHHADCAGNFSPFAECSCGLAEWVTKAEAEATAAAEQRLRADIEEAETDAPEEARRFVPPFEGGFREGARWALNRWRSALDTPSPASPRQGEPVDVERAALRVLHRRYLATTDVAVREAVWRDIRAIDDMQMPDKQLRRLAALSEPAEAET